MKDNALETSPHLAGPTRSKVRPPAIPLAVVFFVCLANSIFMAGIKLFSSLSASVNDRNTFIQLGLDLVGKEAAAQEFGNAVLAREPIIQLAQIEFLSGFGWMGLALGFALLMLSVHMRPQRRLSKAVFAVPALAAIGSGVALIVVALLDASQLEGATRVLRID